MLDSVFLCKTPVYGWLEIWKRDPNESQFILVRSLKNLITNAGRAAFANIQIGLGVAPAYAAVGTGTTAANVLDTALETEVYRAVAVRSRITTIVADDTAYYDATINCLGAFAITEAGLLDLVAVGELFARQVFAAVNVVNGVVLKVVWKLRN